MEHAAGTYRDLIASSGAWDVGAQPPYFHRAMLDATVDCIKIVAPDGTLIHMNKAGCLALGVPEDGDFGMPWLPLLDPSVHAVGGEALGRALNGENARFSGVSGTGSAMRYWDNLLTPISRGDEGVVAVLCVSRDITAKTRLEAELSLAAERERMFAQEMRHRIKNVFGVVSSLVSLSEREAAEEASPAAALQILRGKLDALARASDATFSEMRVSGDPESGADIEKLVCAVMMPHSGRYSAEGPTVEVCSKNVTALALVLHELATNSVKHGSLSQKAGRVLVEWKTLEPGLLVRWEEQGGPAIESEPVRHGFGTRMMERYVRSLGGEIEFKWPRDGLTVSITLYH